MKAVHELGRRAPWLQEGGVWEMAFARDGRRLLTVGQRSVRTWMVATGELTSETARGPRGGSITGTSLAPLADRWVCVADVGSLREFRIWNLATGAYQGEVPFPPGAVSFLAMDSSGTRALLSERDDLRFVQVFSVDEGRVLGTIDTGEPIPGAERYYPTVTFLGDGRIVGSTPTGGIRRWSEDGTDGRVIVEPLFREDGIESNRLNDLFGAPTGGVFAAVYSDGLRIYDEKGATRQESPEFYTPLALSAGGDRIVARDHARLVVFDASGAEIKSWSLEAQQPGRVAISADGRWVAFGMDDGAFSAREVDVTEAPGPTAPRRRDVFPGTANGLSATPDGRALLIACADGSILSWALDAKNPERLPGHGYDSTVVAKVRGDGRMVTSGSGTLRCLAPDGSLEMECAVPNQGLSWSPNGRHAASLSRERTLLVDTASGRARTVPSPMPGPEDDSLFDACAVSNSGRFAMFATTRIAVFAPDGVLVRLVNLPDLPSEIPLGLRLSLAFVTDEQLAFGDTVRGGGVLDIASGVITPIAGSLMVAATDPARNRVAFRVFHEATDEFVLAIWTPAAQTLVELETNDTPTVAEFLPDGRLVTSSASRRIVVWELDA